MSLWPYDPASLRAESDPGTQRLLWPYRSLLSDRVAYGSTQIERGLEWFEYSMFFAKRFRVPLSIAFAFVATHNHFVLDRGGKVFKQSAPVIKLPEGASEDNHLALLGVLNSSAACFWLKQNSHNKGEGGGARVDAGYAARGEPFRETYEFTATTLQDFPLPEVLSLERGRLLDKLATELAQTTPAAVIARGTPSFELLATARAESEQIRGRMVGAQEELDWEVYRLYGLVDDDLTYSGADLPELRLGERAFEIILARAVEAGDEGTTWFVHPEQRATPITEIPAHWPAAYRDLVRRRLEVIASNPKIGLLEMPQYKRRWAQEPWGKRQERALRDWLLDRLEDRRFWFDPQGRPLPRSIGQLADDVDRDRDLASVLSLWEGRPDVPTVRSLTRLLEDECVPFLAAYRYKDPGLRKRQAWEETWDLQRREDAGRGCSGSRCRLSTPRPTSAGSRTGSRARSWMCPRSGSSFTRTRAATLTRRWCSAGRAGTMRSSRWRCRSSSASARRTAGPTSGSFPWSPGWPSCSRGSSSGTPTSIPITGSAWPRSAVSSSPPAPLRSARLWPSWLPGGPRPLRADGAQRARSGSWPNAAAEPRSAAHQIGGLAREGSHSV